MNEVTERSALGSVFDRTMRSLVNRPDVTATKATTIRALTAVLEQAQTFIVQTFRDRSIEGAARDTVFVEYIGTEGSLRLAIPPSVADCISRQRDALGSKNRKLAAKAVAADRKARGILPGFTKRKAAKK
jgi:hypothetical protein